MVQYLTNPPSADVLMNSMRAMGYSFEAAIADIIDNSISANAKTVSVLFPSDSKNLYLGILDDGDGMDERVLFEAMRYGSRSSTVVREKGDLGRFGLGMKSASLSQCRKLTVVSKKDETITAMEWDLDVVKVSADWTVVLYSKDQISEIPCVEKLCGQKNGTLVVWREFDLLFKDSSGQVYKELSTRLDLAMDYLALIFHRFLNARIRPVRINVNGFFISGLDPFLEGNKKTDRRKSIIVKSDIDSGQTQIVVSPYVLPFQKDLSENDYRLLGGKEKLFSQQGFYVYRNNRLIIWGTWFKMKNKNEMTKYARIKVDIPNSMDEQWGIDIKKQNAFLPKSISNNLVRSIEEVLSISKKKNAHRAFLVDSDPKTDHVWNKYRNRENTLEYRINRDSKLLQFYFEKLPSDTIGLVNDILDSVEDCIPYQDIYMDVSQKSLNIELDAGKIAHFVEKGELYIVEMSRMTGRNRLEVIRELLTMDPYNRVNELQEYFGKELQSGNGKVQT